MEIRIPRVAADPSHPRLDWPGRLRDPLCVSPAALTERLRWGEAEPQGRVILGENLRALAALDEGSVRLCYLDPPFFSGARYAFRTRAGGKTFEAPAFDDAWSDLPGYLSFLEDRLRLVVRALAPDGSLYVHLDAHASHYVKVLLDEILGAAAFARQIVWRVGWVSGFKARVRNWVRNHDVLLYYARPGAPFHRQLLPQPEGYRRRGGGEGAGRPVEDVWTDLPSIQLMSFSGEKTGWATQKGEALLRRVIEASSDPGDLVLDPFCGAGTTAVAAAATGRRFVAMDAAPLAAHLTRRRLLEAGVAFTEADAACSDADAAGGGADAAGGGVGAAPPSSADAVQAVATGDPLEVRLDAVPGAAGPTVGALANVDLWWIADPAAAGRPLAWVARRTGPHALEVERRARVTGGPRTGHLDVVAVDLAGALHHGRASLPEPPDAGD